MPSADIVFDTLFRLPTVQRPLKSAIETRGVQRQIDEGDRTVAAIAKAERRRQPIAVVRILCDYLTVVGFAQEIRRCLLSLTPESAGLFLRQAIAGRTWGTTARFLLLPEMKANFDGPHTEDRGVRGGVCRQRGGIRSLDEKSEFWVEFGACGWRRMIDGQAAHAHRRIWVASSATGPIPRCLDIAGRPWNVRPSRWPSGNPPRGRIVAVDWAPVLAVCPGQRPGRERRGRIDTARCPGECVQNRFSAVGYDVALVTNFLHHFDLQTTCTKFLEKDQPRT